MAMSAEHVSKFAALRRNEVAFHGGARQSSLPAHCNSQWDVINQNMDIVIILLIKKMTVVVGVISILIVKIILLYASSVVL